MSVGRCLTILYAGGCLISLLKGPRRECQAAPEEEFDFSIGLWHNWPPVLATSALYRHRVTYTHSMLNGWLSIHPPARSPANHHTQRRLLLVLHSGYPRVWLGYAETLLFLESLSHQLLEPVGPRLEERNNISQQQISQPELQLT